MQFDLDATLNSGDVMLSVKAYSSFGVQIFDWSNIKVTGLGAWATALAANNVNTATLTLYNGPGAYLTLNNYALALVSISGDYKVGKKSEASGTGTVWTRYILLDGNRFQNAGHGVNVTTYGGAAPYWAPIAGLSTYGNTTNHNVNITGGSHTAAYAGFTAE